MAHAELQVKEVLSPGGFMYMVTVMDNGPEEILQLLSDDNIEGGYLLLSRMSYHISSCLQNALLFSSTSHQVAALCCMMNRRCKGTHGNGHALAAPADARDSDVGKVILERAADEEALRILCCWRRGTEGHH